MARLVYKYEKGCGTGGDPTAPGIDVEERGRPVETPKQCYHTKLRLRGVSAPSPRPPKNVRERRSQGVENQGDIPIVIQRGTRKLLE